MGINPTFKISNAKVSFAELSIKSNFFTKTASLVKVSSSTNKSSDNELLFIFEEESVTKSFIKSGSTTKRVGSIKLSRFNRKKVKSVLPK